MPQDHVPEAKPPWRRIALAAVVVAVSLAFALAASWLFFLHTVRTAPADQLATEAAGSASRQAEVSPLLLSHQLDLPGRGEVFPALTAGSASDYWPVAILTVSNRGDRPVLETIHFEIAGWSRPQQVTVVIGPQETRTLQLNPDLLPNAFTNDEVRRALLHVRAGTSNVETVFAQARPVLIHGAGDLYWGQRFANAQFVARWVTPHDPEVLSLVSQAKRFVPDGRFTGYRSSGTPAQQAAWVRQQALAVFRALQRSGISYVSSIFTFGDYVGQAQRIRLPRETLTLTAANCIDVSVAFASAIENLGMQPVVVIVPGHAFAGVRLAPGSNDILYLDLTVLPKGTFAQAQARAQGWLKKTSSEKLLTVDVAAARLLKIYPLPGPGATNTQTAAIGRNREASDR